MFRNVFHPNQLRQFTAQHQHRTFVSTVLLSRTWENETVVDLRKEARHRGLSTKGNKSTLITRIQSYEEQQAAGSSSSQSPAPAAARSASTQAVAPGLPSASQPASSASIPAFMNVKMPDLSQPEPEVPVQIPSLPDLWDSARLKPKLPQEAPIPKIHVVSGSATHHGGGPTHSLESTHETEAHKHAEAPPADPAPAGGFWRDLADDMGLPRTIKVGQAVLESDREATGVQKVQSRPLDKEETRGVWVLLGLLAGSWLVGGYVNGAPATAPTEEDGKDHTH
ncbi:hypothetical protein BV22DRAFT_707009 [Leucogyrophana mollusca]|uniref:Uncharacterized protein n=1 Tax=Leucogyrophana mollusca TaxID=85980 RepID=A0ACB8B8H2_9AGAM|nr:hypothetical protein BV22DRAFT_707009 [Leucogyrophana mollusca]